MTLIAMTRLIIIITTLNIIAFPLAWVIGDYIGLKFLSPSNNQIKKELYRLDVKTQDGKNITIIDQKDSLLKAVSHNKLAYKTLPTYFITSYNLSKDENYIILH